MDTPLVETVGLTKHFKTPHGLLHAIDKVDLKIGPCRTLGVVGESGCGKSTLGRTVLGLQAPTSGEVYFEGKSILGYRRKQMKAVHRDMQMIFQDPYSSLDPRMSIFDLIAEPLRELCGRELSRAEVQERVLDINPDIQVTLWKTFYLPDTADQFDLTQYDYIVDAIDTVTGKLELITRAKAAGTPILCAMGTGNKLDPTSFTVTDISKTSGDGLARVMRKELKKRGITHLKVVYSTELPHKTLFQPEPEPGSTRRSTPGSVPFVPPVAGLIAASQVVKDLLAK